MIEMARAFCVAAHGAAGQFRKYTNEPYSEHPERVAGTVANFGGNTAMIVSALLHDVPEDTPIEFETIHRFFGPSVAMLVKELTNVSKPEDGNRAVRKEKDLQHLATVSAEAKTIKLADLKDNTTSIVRYDEAFARKYIPEKMALMDVLRAGHGDLWTENYWTLLYASEKLGIPFTLSRI